MCGGPVFFRARCLFTHRELEEQIATAGRDISLVSDLDWMASKLLNTIVHFLGLSTTASHANLVWHMRDSYLSKVHQLVPKATKDALRMSPLNSEHLFKEETVVIASANLKSDLQLQTNQKALLRLQTPASTRGTAKRPTGQQVVQNPTPKRVRFDQPGSFQGAARGWNSSRGNQYPKKSGKGRGRGKPK